MCNSPAKASSTSARARSTTPCAPKSAAGRSRQAPVLKIGSFEIPIGIEGPWENPAFTVKGQEQLTDMVKHLGKLLKSKEAQEALEGLIGGDRGKRAKQREHSKSFSRKSSAPASATPAHRASEYFVASPYFLLRTATVGPISVGLRLSRASR